MQERWKVRKGMGRKQNQQKHQWSITPMSFKYWPRKLGLTPSAICLVGEGVQILTCSKWHSQHHHFLEGKNTLVRAFLSPFCRENAGCSCIHRTPLLTHQEHHRCHTLLCAACSALPVVQWSCKTSYWADLCSWGWSSMLFTFKLMDERQNYRRDQQSIHRDGEETSITGRWFWRSNSECEKESMSVFS